VLIAVTVRLLGQLEGRLRSVRSGRQ
jgi:hypothetical protein